MRRTMGGEMYEKPIATRSGITTATKKRAGGAKVLFNNTACLIVEQSTELSERDASRETVRCRTDLQISCLESSQGPFVTT